MILGLQTNYKDSTDFPNIAYPVSPQPHSFSFNHVVYLFIYGSAGSSPLLGFSLLSASRVYSLVAVLELLIAVVSLVA